MPGAPVAALLARADARNGARLFGPCSACHTVSQGAPDGNGPNLYGVLGAPIASNRPRFSYTYALRSVGGRWDVERMNAWLENPQRFAPGTHMIFPGVHDAWERADLIAYLGTKGSRLPLPGSGPGTQGE
ncbi:c-type cytochrome [Roseomonas elaeocarpi]|uniref:C-type cytochrome n=1 Tax=Roseomonas elaeocarpi TaxID=907779 RepID=A0ABV6JTK2_9PROT